MANGISSNGVCIFVIRLDRKKHPALCVTVENDDQIYKVASFDSDVKAEWFLEVANECLSGFDRKGRWISGEEAVGTISIPVPHCSNCGAIVPVDVSRYKYCPGCGARMENVDG